VKYQRKYSRDKGVDSIKFMRIYSLIPHHKTNNEKVFEIEGF